MRKVLWKVLPLIIGFILGIFIFNPPELFRSWGIIGWLILPACFFVLLFILFPGCLFAQIMFQDVKFIPVERDLRRKDIRDLAEQFWKLGFRPAVNALRIPNPPGTILGFVREDIAVTGAILRIEVGFGKTTFAFASSFGDDTKGLTTVRSTSAALEPRAAWSFYQAFPGYDMEELLLEHLRSLEWLHSHGLTAYPISGEMFGENELNSSRSQREYLRKDWFNNTVKFVWRFVSKMTPHRGPISKQKIVIDYIRQIEKPPTAIPESQARQNLIKQLEQLLAIPADLPHSGFGIASFAISLGCSLVVFLAIVFAGIIGVVKGGATDRNSPVTIAFGLMIMFCGLGYFIGLALGIAGVMDKHRKKIFAVLGIVINILGLSLLAGLIILGNMLGHH
jgi:hypothetical protein